MVKNAALILVTALLVPGCGEEPVADSPSPWEPAGAEVPILRKFPPSTNGGINQESRNVARDPAIWAHLWGKANAHLTPVPKAPAVDFTKEMVMLAALGQRPSSGHSVEIVGVREDGGKLVVLLAVREPAKGSMAATVVTAPWHAVVIAKSDLSVEWRNYEAPK